MAYTKLFNSIVTSTIWTEDDKTRIVWITMLALADKNGEVAGSVPGLARIAGVPVEAARIALEKFMAPDPDSRTRDDEGRRIEEIDGGWALLNHAKYRRMASKDENKERTRERVRRFREKACNKSVTHVTQCNDLVTHERDIAEAEADTDPLSVHPSDVSPEQTAKPVSPEPVSRKSLPDELFLAEIKRHYPDIDVEAELRKMDAWLLTRPGKKKTRRFIVGWLNRTDPGLKSQPTTGGKYDNAW
jgi:hypothetical protein